MRVGSFDKRPVLTGVVAGLWFIGLLCALTPFDAFQTHSMLLCVLSVGLAGFLSLAAARSVSLVEVLQSPLLLLSAVFWALAGVSVLASDAPFISFIYFCMFSLFPLSFYLTLFSMRSVLHWIWVGLCCVLLALCVAAFVQYFAMPSLLSHGLARWPFSNPNLLGAVFACGCLTAFGGMLASHDRRISNVLLIVTLISFAALMTTGSRGAFLSLVVVLPFMMLWGREALSRHGRCTLGVLIGAVLIFAGFGVLPGASLSPAGIAVETLNAQYSILSDRPALWASTWAIFQDHFWTGTGVGTFFLYYPSYRGADYSSAGLAAHSSPLEFASDMGVFALLLFYCFLAYAAVVHFKAMALRRAAGQTVWPLIVPFCALGVLILHAHVSFHFQSPPLLMLIGVLLGAWLVAAQPGLKAVGVSKTVFQRPVLALALMVGLVLYSHAQVSFLYLNKGEAAMARQDMQGFADAVNFAGVLSANQNPYVLLAAAEIPVGSLQFSAALMEPAQAEALYGQAMALLEKAEKANPQDADIYYARAEAKRFAYRIARDAGHPAAQKDLEQALAINPLHMRARMMLSDFVKREAGDEAALEVLAAGLKWPYHKVDPRFYHDKTAGLAASLGRDDVVEQVRIQRARYLDIAGP